MQDNIENINSDTILGISLSAKYKKSSSSSILIYTLDQLRSIYPNTRYLSVSDFRLPHFQGLMPDEITDPSYITLYKAIRTSRAIILSVPCYWAGISGVAKNFIDILCGPLYDYPGTYKSVFHGKIIAAIIVGADEASASEGEVQLGKIIQAVGGNLLPAIVRVNNPRNMTADDEKKLNEDLLRLNYMLIKKLKTNESYSHL